MKRGQIAWTAASLVLIVLVLLDHFQPLAYVRLCNLYRDATARIGRKTSPNSDLVFLAIDSNSVTLDDDIDLNQTYKVERSSEEGRALKLMSQRFPWPRETYALIIKRLVEAGAKAVLIDLTFSSVSADDEPFRLALDRYKDRVVIGSNFEQSRNGMKTTVYMSPADSIVPQSVPADDRVAFTNFWPDQDDTVRAAQFRVTAEQVQGNEPSPDSEILLSLVARGLTKAGLADVIPSGFDSHSFRFTGWPAEGFPPHSIVEIFVPEFWEHNYLAGQFFRGKIVVIGGYGNWQHDEHPTPFGLMPGPEVHLNAMNAALRGEFIRDVSPWLALILIAGAGTLAVALTLLIRSPWQRLAGLGLLTGGTVWGTLQVYNYASTYLPVVPPLIELNLAVLIGFISDLSRERIEKKQVRRTLEKYVSKNVVRELLDKPESYTQTLGGVIRPVSILFSDIRGYSIVSSRTDPQVLVCQLNEYLTAMVECVFRFDGTLDKFIGDAVMAVWGNTHSDGLRNDATNAVQAALAMRAELERLNKAWEKRGLPQLRIGIGINHGEVVVGNIGSPKRMDFTVIGDSVNVTWKLQELTKEFGADIIVSENVSALVNEEFELRDLGQVEMSGLSQPLEIFALCGPKPLEIFELGGPIDLRADNSNAVGLLQ